MPRLSPGLFQPQQDRRAAHFLSSRARYRMSARKIPAGSRRKSWCPNRRRGAN